MKKYVIEFINSVIKKSKIKENKVKICIIGLTYKYGVADTRNSQKIEILKYYKKKFKYTKGFDPFLDNSDDLSKDLLKNYNFFIFTKGQKFKDIANKINKKKMIDPFSYYSN